MAKRKALTKAPRTINDQMAMRFAQQYIMTLDPTRAAVNTGIAYDGDRIDYGLAESLGSELVNHPQVLNHIRYLNEKSAHSLKLDVQRFNDLLGEMIQVTMLDYLLWDDTTNGYRLKPLAMLTQAELLCLKDANQYQHMFTTGAVSATPQQTAQPATTTATQQFTITLIDKTKLMDLYAKVNSFYKPNAGDSNPEDVARRVRDALRTMDETDGPEAKVVVDAKDKTD